MRRFYGAHCIFVVLFMLSIPVMLWGKTLQITWNANTEKDLSGYRVYYGTSSQNYTYSLNVGITTSVTVDGFLEGNTYYVAVTAYDYSGNESRFSQEVSVVVPSASEGEGLLTKIMNWVAALFGVDQAHDSPLADYSIQDFNNMGAQQVAQALDVVRVGGANSNTVTTLEPVGKSEYVIRDAIAMVGEYFDLSLVYPDGTYFFLPITEETPSIDNSFFTAPSPGVYLYLVADSNGEYLHILRISVLDMMYVYSDYEFGSQMYLEDPDFGISIALSPEAIEENVPIAIGQNYVDILDANAMTMRGKSVLEFSIVPYGLALSEPAEIRVAFEGSSAAAEYFDETDKVWKTIPDVKVEDGQVVFSTQTLGKFRVYGDAASDSGAGGSGGSGGGCFISACE